MGYRDTLVAVTDVLPAQLTVRLNCLKEEELGLIEEFRLRRGYPMTVLISGRECPLGGRAVEEQDLREVLERASRASAHTVLEQVANGFVTIRGGHRIGLCGTVSKKNGEIYSLRHLSSLSIRVAKAIEGQASALISGLMEHGRLLSTLIVGPPGSGKTTMLRELIRVYSDGHGVPPHRIGVADERGEIAALWQGIPQFRVGKQTDILDGCAKAEGLSILLRGMNPQVLAVDEITRPEDAEAILEAANCGVELLATAHGRGIEDLHRRPVYRSLLEHQIFRRAVFLERRGNERAVRVEVLS